MSAIICFALFMGAMVACLATGYDMIWALLFGIALFLLRGKANGYSWRDMWKAMWDEGSKLLSLIVIFLLIGVITGLWRSCGTIAFFIYHGIRLITPKLFILVAFLLTCLLSYALGTSFDADERRNAGSIAGKLCDFAVDSCTGGHHAGAATIEDVHPPYLGDQHCQCHCHYDLCAAHVLWGDHEGADRGL